VHTGVALVLPQVAVPEGQAGPFCRTFSTTTNVIFHELSPELIEAYIATGEGPARGKLVSAGLSSGPAGGFKGV
jgi:predicted house-cleaning NTP pyrophosphatase (Maf/HAM1 superfamily)